jgi:hypothetical protein
VATVVTFDGGPGSLLEAAAGITGWAPDRTPVKIEGVFGAAGAALSFKVDGKGSTADFYHYQGAKIVSGANPNGFFNLGHGSEVSYKFFIDPKWLSADNTDQQVSGVWVQMQNADATLPTGGRYSIAEYLDPDAAKALTKSGDNLPEGLATFTGGFRFWELRYRLDQIRQRQRAGLV